MSDYRKPLRELNWKKIGKDITKLMAHIIGIVSLTFCAFWMILATYSFKVVGGIILYEFNMTISIIEFILTVYAFIYGWYLLVKLYRGIE